MNRYLPSCSRGFSLIEVLVTLLLTSIGILGMVAMQAKAIAYTQDSIQRNAAAMLADELMEIMRADTNNVMTANGRPRESSDYYKTSGSFPDAANDCSSLPTDPAGRLGCWAKHASQVLPGASDLLNSEFHVKPVDSTIEIQLAWSVATGACLELDGDDTATVCRYRLRAEL